MWLYHTVMSPNDADRMANSVDPHQTAPLIWVCTVCPGISVRKLRIVTVLWMSFFSSILTQADTEIGKKKSKIYAMASFFFKNTSWPNQIINIYSALFNFLAFYNVRSITSHKHCKNVKQLFYCQLEASTALIPKHIWASSRENLFLPYANNKGADQPAHPRSLISTFVVHCLDSILSLVSLSEISSL